ncbi:HlyD family efflux transporter periplasmic adaptor subunit [Methylobacterium sp. NEAU 140]|uniref:efflux RND transporter periplasmic adaptor subunit n=1 Tax=Methylobacterium sp. NEAU 140 TaxID=3064945 RepID=UPI002732604C|nr:HlyD family efflux transporter periplasmic adaptor subunit [Methylobacterium sp. NEAU 140]MDP4025815.1 HlyD family efflux transporter periplasmic adaptor subunit [Methylobacterium sp. NEAU 140]
MPLRRSRIPGPLRPARGRARGRGAALLAAAWVAAVPAIGAAPRSAAADAPRRAALSVSVSPARAQCFTDRVEVTGTLAPHQQVDVGAEREGLKAAQILARPLDIVTAGQALARLVPADGPESAAVTVRAPVAGVVLRSQGTVGQPVSPRQGPMFQLIAGGELDLVAEAPLADLGRIRLDQPVTVRALGGAEIQGRVRRIDPAAEPAAQVGRLRIGLGANPDLRTGTFARGVVTVGRRCGVGVSYSAVQYEPDGTIVQVVAGDRIETRQVSVGLLDGTDAEILSGLSEADLVVVRAGPFVREGDLVEPIQAGAAR